MGTDNGRIIGVAVLGTAGLAVTVAGAVANVLAYGVPVLGARHLDAAGLSTLATLLALGAIAGVASTGLQIAVAVHRARHGRVSAAVPTVRTVAVTAVALAVLLPPAVVSLRLPMLEAVLLAVATLAVVAAGRWLGELQGDQRFVRLAAAMAVLALGRYGGVVAGLALDGGLTGALAGGAVTAILVLPVLMWLAGSAGPPQDGPPVRPGVVFTAGSATLAMLVVSYADLLLARRYLPLDASGAYAVGTVLTKGALWAPQVVTVIALPRLARGDRRTLGTALALVGACGALLVLVSAVAGGLAFRLAGGTGYTGYGGYAAIFAATGSLYALVFVLVNAQVAAGARWPSAPMWVFTAVFVVAVAVAVPHTLAGIATSALVTAAATFAATGLAVWLRSRATAAPSGVSQLIDTKDGAAFTGPLDRGKLPAD
jgi:O-antigen/teichoic acid export membrane protein